MAEMAMLLTWDFSGLFRVSSSICILRVCKNSAWPIDSVKSLGVGVGNGKESFGTILIAPKHDFFSQK